MTSKRDVPGFSLTRRRLLQGACAAVGSAAVGMFGFERFARADLPLPSGRAFIFCYFPGGWDQLLFLDPRDPTAPGMSDENRGTNLFETRYGELEGVAGFSSRLLRPASASSPLAFGPATAKANDAVTLASFADRVAVVRGMSMSTLGHEVGYRYFLTGKFPAGAAARGSSVATEIVAQMAPRRPVANLALRVETYNDRHPGSASALRVDNINDLLLVLQPSAFQERDVVERALAQYGQTVAPCAVESLDRRGLLTQMRAARSQADEIVRENLAARFRFVSDNATDAGGNPTEAARIRALYGFAQGDVNAPGARAAMAAQAVKLGVSQVVSISIGNGTDTHFTGNAGHANLLYPGIKAFTTLLQDLATTPHPEGGSFLDHTTLLGFSEFSRTPLFNQFGGRDHHLTGSCILAGAGIRGNSVFGASSDVGMAAQRWDFANNRPSDSGEIIRPEHICATLMASAGLDPSIMRVNPIRALLAT